MARNKEQGTRKFIIELIVLPKWKKLGAVSNCLAIIQVTNNELVNPGVVREGRGSCDGELETYSGPRNEWSWKQLEKQQQRGCYDKEMEVNCAWESSNASRNGWLCDEFRIGFEEKGKRQRWKRVAYPHLYRRWRTAEDNEGDILELPGAVQPPSS